MAPVLGAFIERFFAEISAKDPSALRQQDGDELPPAPVGVLGRSADAGARRTDTAVPPGHPERPAR